MSENSVEQPAKEIGWFGKLISFRGNIGRGKYLLGLVGELGILFVGLAALAGLNNPTGTVEGAIFFAAVFPIIAVYFHMCLVTARLRDAGSPNPVPAGIIVGVLPFIWVVLTLEWIESLWVMMLIGVLVLYLVPAFPKSKAAETPQS